MTRRFIHVSAVAVLAGILMPSLGAQEYGKADGDAPGDAMIQDWLAREAAALHARFDEDLASIEDFARRRREYREQYMHMLGLSPRPERTPLEATVTGTIDGDGFTVDMLHYQSRPGLYVTGNLYRPSPPPAEKLPAVFYVCGHSGMGRNGNKTAFQSHGIWFARHGYICLVVDTLQLGEIAALHHGTYREERWWWHSRGYTPAGVECWNGVRGVDYLLSRGDVDPTRIAVTGISGGGAATFWIAAADERVSVAAPVSGMADLPSYVTNRVINGHCDCMFLYNTYRWPWTRIAGLIAPRPLLFVNSDSDSIFPMDANERIINRLERLYSLFGRGDDVDALVSVGGHAYRADIRQGVYRFVNSCLKSDSRRVADAEVDLVVRSGPSKHYPIAPERLRVFPGDGDIPKDERNTRIDDEFVPMASPAPDEHEAFTKWKTERLRQLREIVFRALPERIPPARRIEGGEKREVETEPGIRLPLSRDATRDGSDVVLVVRTFDDAPIAIDEASAVYTLQPRGIGPTRWTRRNPPNYVERSHVLLGTTVDTERLRDVIATARMLRATMKDGARLRVAGRGHAAGLALYAALLEPEIDGIVLAELPKSHMEKDAPQFLNVLRVCDLADARRMLR